MNVTFTVKVTRRLLILCSFVFTVKVTRRLLISFVFSKHFLQVCKHCTQKKIKQVADNKHYFLVSTSKSKEYSLSANTRLAKSTKNARLQYVWSAPHLVPKRLSPFMCIWITPIQPEPFCLGMGFADAICMQLWTQEEITALLCVCALY